MPHPKTVASAKIYLDCRKLIDLLLDVIPQFLRDFKFAVGAKMQEISVNLVRLVAAAYQAHDPTVDCIRRSPKEMWNNLALGKSLFTVLKNKGIAIGNLFAQLFANFLLNLLDWFIESLGFKRHGRYVDDFDTVDSNKQALLDAIPKIRAFLAKFGLKLNERKTYIQHFAKGVRFTGFVVKPGRKYIDNRVINNFRKQVFALNNASNQEEAIKAVNRINSYLGLLRHGNEYANRRSTLSLISHHTFRKYVFIKGRFEAVTLKPHLYPSYSTYKSISRGTFLTESNHSPFRQTRHAASSSASHKIYSHCG